MKYGIWTPPQYDNLATTCASSQATNPQRSLDAETLIEVAEKMKENKNEILDATISMIFEKGISFENKQNWWKKISNETGYTLEDLGVRARELMAEGAMIFKPKGQDCIHLHPVEEHGEILDYICMVSLDSGCGMENCPCYKGRNCNEIPPVDNEF